MARNNGNVKPKPNTVIKAKTDHVQVQINVGKTFVFLRFISLPQMLGFLIEMMDRAAEVWPEAEVTQLWLEELGKEVDHEDLN